MCMSTIKYIYFLKDKEKYFGGDRFAKRTEYSKSAEYGLLFGRYLSSTQYGPGTE